MTLDLQDILSRPFRDLPGLMRPMDAVPDAISFAERTRAPASSEQRRLWLDAQHHPHSRAYSVPLIYDLRGPVDADRLSHAFTATFAAHPAFSTALVEADGALWQVQRPRSNCRFHAYSSGQIIAQTCEAQTQAIFAEPFDLASAALCQVYWMPFEETAGRLVIHAHHVLFDGWSLNLFLDEVSQRYNDPDFEPEAPHLDMAGFAAWQDHAARTEEQRAQRARLGQIWTDTAPPEPPLTTLRAQEPSSARTYSRDLAAAQLSPLHLMAQSRGVTPFHLFTMVCGWAFSQVTGQRRFNIASPTSNRQRADSDATIGMMANTVIFPVSLEPDQTRAACVDGHHEVWARVMGCADVPLEHLYVQCGIEDARDKLRFDCLFVMENTDYARLALAGVSARFSHPARVAPKAAIVVFVTPTETGATLHAEIDDSRFSPEDATRFMDAFAAGLVGLADPQSPCAALTEPPTAVLHGPEQSLETTTVAGLLRAQADRTPHSIALRDADKTLTYARLMARANALSHWFSTRIVSQEAPVVALLTDGGPEHVIAIVALAQINATILPLDPDLPTAKLENIVAQARPALILGARADAPPALGGQPIVLFPELEERAEFTPSHAGNPLYLLFTSGSTGTPKGVRVWDESLCNLLQWQTEYDGLHGPARTQQFSRLSFDVSFQEILTTLTTGGTLTLMPPDLRHDAEGILCLMRDTRAQRIFLPFVALKLLAETALTADQVLPDLRQVISAGETLACTGALRDWFGRMPDARLINHYGPTETHVIASHHLPADPDTWPDVAPIGLPISNCRFNIAQPSGELRVAGPFIRPCYLDPAQNDARFRQDDGPQYLTGDRVALLRNDRLICLGRLDDQIKISGHRIERQEIETILNRHPDVALAAVTLSAEGHPVAFVEPSRALPDVDSLNACLAAELPAAVRLKQVVRITEWPRTATGKIDRRALALPEPVARDTPPFEAPESDIDTLCHIFQRVVGRSIAPTQTFWAAGANSLDLMRYRNAVQQALSCRIAVADLFGKGTTPKRLARMLRGDQDHTPQTPPPAAGPKSDEIAIIGIAVDLPGARDSAEFAAMIVQNLTGVETFSAQPGKIGARSQLAAPLGFDPGYFGISPQEAVLMDPQQRHLLMNAVQVLGDAGLDPQRSPRSIGVIASCGENTYFQDMLRNGDPDGIPDPFQMALHHDKDFAATKLAYRLGLTGPALTVQAACGSSLIGVHTAAGMLRQGDCDVMLVGASLVDPTLGDGYTWRANHIFSKDGSCRPFDAQASGTIGASGVCFVALAPLSQALADGHRIYATLAGSAINNDGRDKMSYTAPSATGQRAALSQALSAAGLEGADVGYIEAHGTGTPLGDPIEIDAIDAVYGQRDDPLHVSSLKSQIGHLGAAAGLAGLIRATLAIRQRVTPPNLHFDTANPELNLAERRIDIPATAQPWSAPTRRAGISSFGIGGTNAHAIIAQFHPAAPRPEAPAPQALLISAHCPKTLRRWAGQIADYLDTFPERAAGAMQFLRFGAPLRACRAAFVWTDVDDAVARLRSIDDQTPPKESNAAARLCQKWLDGRGAREPAPASPAPFGFPVYPFDIAPFDFKRRPATPAPAHGSGRRDPAEWFLQPFWAPLGPPTAPPDTAAVAIVLRDPATDLSKLRGYVRVITLEISETAARLSDDHFRTTAQAQDLTDIARQIVAQKLPGRIDILNALPLEIGAGIAGADRAFAQLACLDVMPGLVALARGLERDEVRLIHLSQGGASAATGRMTHPLTNLLCGPCEVLPTETGLPVHWLDLQPGTRDRLPDCLHAPTLPEGRSAFAHGQLWERRRAPLPRVTQPTTLPRRAVVIGGTGGIGRNICKALLGAGTSRIDILARDPKLPTNLSAFSDSITLHALDLCADRVVWPAFDSPVDTVIFAAGVGSYAPTASRDAAQMRARNRVKIDGAAHVETLLRELQPQRVIYCSSMAAEMGGNGQLDYAAVNGLLDAMAHYDDPQAPEVRRLTLNWDIWSQSGMAVNALARDAQHRAHLEVGLTDEEGRATFVQALRHGCPQVLISTLDLTEARQFYAPAPIAARASAARQSPLDLIVATVADLLDIENPDIDIAMADIGVDSLMMIDLLESLRAQFDTVPDLSAIAPDASIADLAELMQPVSPTAAPIDTLRAVFARTLGVSDVAADDTMLALCIDSLHAIDLIENIDAEFGTPLSVNDFSEERTVADVLRRIADDRPPPAALPPVTVERWRAGASGRIVCFVHPVGGETACYKPLLQRIAPDVTVLAIADPKLRAMDPGAQPLASQAAAYLAALKEQLGTDIASVELVGWSYGGWLAQEMAVQAEADGTCVAHVAMIDPPDPDSGERIGRIDRAEIQDAFLFELAPRLSSAARPGRPLETQIAPELQNQLDRLVTCCALNMQAMQTHRPRCLRRTQASVFVADTAAAGLLVTPVDAHAHLDRWRSLLEVPRYSVSLPSDHYSILQAPAVDQIAKYLFG
ncbi:AMP-binding protein [Sulfitobacter albidus]|uniref:AMP-binding protein n=1 Tax=Sulfitobacter albidus TaxID=2829501 RepID=A0A975PMG7_9RHOB|nr:AMP-binding protein [Sulfitobacter albidus]QUJ76787.1 AMP-binding protein [Sulfitobacter albidus]